MKLITAGQDIDPFPLVKLFTPDGGATWLLTKLNPDDLDIASACMTSGLAAGP